MGTLINCLQDGMPDKIICHGNTLETQGSIYDFEIKKPARQKWQLGKRGCGVWLSEPGAGQKATSQQHFIHESPERPRIEWHGKKNTTFSNNGISVAGDGTSVEITGPDLDEVKLRIASAAVVYLRVKLLQKLLIAYAVFEAALLFVGYLLYKNRKRPAASCIFFFCYYHMGNFAL
ncbi:MAG TPA: hypothetical protein DDY31_08790 [Lachnospiraceae bacterium]|nr:hypothetical protein [Lachnospiraceae bacterium]